jgi:hypothetical protein
MFRRVAAPYEGREVLSISGDAGWVTPCWLPKQATRYPAFPEALGQDVVHASEDTIGEEASPCGVDVDADA